MHVTLVLMKLSYSNSNMNTMEHKNPIFEDHNEDGLSPDESTPGFLDQSQLSEKTALLEDEGGGDEKKHPTNSW